MDDELYLKERLALDERQAKVLEKKVNSFLSTLQQESVESAQIQLENLLILLSNYQTSLERHPPIQLANEKEIEDYKQVVDNTAIIRTKAAADIITLKDDLVIAQRMRDQKLEYDRVARDIMKFETRDTYAESIQELQSDISLLQREKQSKLAAFESRKHNLSRLVTTLKDLQKSVEDERAVVTDDQKTFMDMERGYVSSDDEGDIGLSDEEPEAEEEKEVAPATTFHRFQERNDDEEEEDEDEEEGIVLDTPMVE